MADEIMDSEMNTGSGPPEADLSSMTELHIKEEPDNAPSSSTPAESQSSPPPPSTHYGPPIISNNAPGFRYKYPGAAPTPPGADDADWNKIYTAADSRFYNKHGKSSTESKKYRDRGETYTLALKMLEEKREKRRKEAEGGGPPPKAKRAAPPKKPVETTVFKKDPPFTTYRDLSPVGDAMAMGIAEKIKAHGRARKPVVPAAPSSDRGTPAPTSAAIVTTPPKMAAPDLAGKKKGTAIPAKKPVAKPKALGLPLIAKPPAPKPINPSIKTEGKSVTPAGSRRPSVTPGPGGNSTDSESNDGGEYCICRGPDDHRMMVNCEGGCEDWYHCSCVGIDEEDTRELLDRYVCPNCTTESNYTTWKPMCRFGNVGRHLGNGTACRKAARVTLAVPSKYCSDEHKMAFWKFIKSQVREDKEPSKGGALNQDEVGWLLAQTKTADEIHALGEKPRLPQKEESDPDHPVGLDYLTFEEQQNIKEIQNKKAIIQSRIEGFQNYQKVLLMINKRSKLALQQPNLDNKDPCGYDNRLAMNEVQFAAWCNTKEGKTALEDGVIGPRTQETKHIGAHIIYPGQSLPEPVKVSDALDNICLRSRKKCQQHTQWREIHGNEFAYSQRVLKEELMKLSKTESEIIADAETREATKGYYSSNTTEQLF